MTNAFYRVDENNNAVILDAETGEQLTTLDANVYPVGSSLSARYEHAEGLILSIEDAEKLGILPE